MPCSVCSLLQGYYFCVKQYALECSRIPMGQSVNSQVMALQTQLVLLGVGGCCGTERAFWVQQVLESLAPSWKSRTVQSLLQSHALCSRLLEQTWSAMQGDGRFYKRMTLVLALGSKLEHAGKEQEQFWPKMAAPGKASAWKAGSFLLPLSKREAEWEQGSVNMAGCPLLEQITFYTMSSGS